MKRAFEENLPKFKPRVRFQPSGAPSASDDQPESRAPVEVVSPSGQEGALAPGGEPPAAVPAMGRSVADVHAAVHSAAQAVLTESAPPESAASRARPARVQAAQAPIDSPAPKSTAAVAPPVARQAGVPTPEMAGGDDPTDARRRKLRARLWALQNPAPAFDGESPRAPEAVVAAAEGLAEQLADARGRVDRLERDLSRARTDLTRAVAEAEVERQRVDGQQAQLAEARQLLAGLESELSMLEEERDEVLAEVRVLRQADGARRESLTSLSKELDQARRSLSEARAEQAEIVRELETGDAQLARLSQELSRLDGEKSQLIEQLTELSGAKGELANSRRTLERVHKLLAVAAAPIKR